MFDGKTVPGGTRDGLHASRARLGEAPLAGTPLTDGHPARPRLPLTPPAATPALRDGRRPSRVEPRHGRRRARPRRGRRTRSSRPARELRLRLVRRAGVSAPVPAQRRPAGLHVRLREVPGRRDHARLPLQPRPRAPRPPSATRRRSSSESRGTCPSPAPSRRSRLRTTRASKAFTRWRTEDAHGPEGTRSPHGRAEGALHGRSDPAVSDALLLPLGDGTATFTLGEDGRLLP